MALRDTDIAPVVERSDHVGATERPSDTALRTGTVDRFAELNKIIPPDGLESRTVFTNNSGETWFATTFTGHIDNGWTQDSRFSFFCDDADGNRLWDVFGNPRSFPTSPDPSLRVPDGASVEMSAYNPAFVEAGYDVSIFVREGGS